MLLRAVVPCFEALPHAVQLKIFTLLPLDTRLRCVEVSRAWQRTLQDTAAWTHLVVPASPSPTRTNLQLRAALARASGMLEVLDVSAVKTDPGLVFDLITQLGLCAVLRELRLSTHTPVHAPHVLDILNVAPELQLLSVTVNWKDRNWDYSDAMLRNDHPFEAVRVCTLVLHTEFTDTGVIAQGNSLVYQPLFAELQAAVAQCNHSELREIGVDCPVDAVIMKFIADVAEARTPALLVSGLDAHDDWQSGCIDVVFRLLRSNALPHLTFGLWAAELLREGDPAVWTELCGAVQGCTSLKNIVIDRRVAHHFSRLNELIAALVNHPHVENIDVVDAKDEEQMEAERFDPNLQVLELDASYRVGRGLAALLAADLPGLRSLSLVDMGLDEAGLALVLRALARNTHLEELALGWRESRWAYNPVPSVTPYFSMDFIERELLPAVQRNRSLRTLVVQPRFDGQGYGAAAWDLDEEQLEQQQAIREVEAHVQNRSDPAVHAAARGWQVARYKWTAPRMPL